MSIYEINVANKNGLEMDLKRYQGKTLLIVNTATECGFTPQYDALERIYETYQDQGLEVLDFPCNQFGNQAPGSIEEISEFCQLRFNTKFDRFGKVEVNGENEAPLFKFLKKEKGFEGLDRSHNLAEVLEGIYAQMNPEWETSSDIKWNFTKFLVDKNGNVVARFEPTEDMSLVEAKIKEVL